MPVIVCRYWQKTTARDRNEMIRMASSSRANARGIAAAREEIRKSELMVMAGTGKDATTTVGTNSVSEDGHGE